MTVFVIDIATLAIVAFCGWRGYKNGLIRGVFGIAALIAALFIANIAAKAYSVEFVGMLRPFVGGIVESAITDLNDEGNADEPDALKENEDDEFGNESEEFVTTYKVLRSIGLPKSVAARIAGAVAGPESAEDGVANDAAEESEGISRVRLPRLIADNLSDKLAYVAVFGVAFVLLAIIFAVIGNLINFVFSLPGLRLVDAIAGAVFGIAKGLIIVLALTAVLRYFGIVAYNTIGSTSVLNYLINHNIIADKLGI